MTVGQYFLEKTMSRPSGATTAARLTHEPEHRLESYDPASEPEEFPTYRQFHKGKVQSQGLPVSSYSNWNGTQQKMLDKSLALLKGLNDPKLTEDAELLERLRDQNRLKVDPNEKDWGCTRTYDGKRLTISFPPKSFWKTCASADTPEKQEFWKHLFFTSTAAHEATHARGDHGMLSEHDAAHEEVRLMGLLEKKALKSHAPAWQIHMIRAMKADPYQGGK